MSNQPIIGISCRPDTSGLYPPCPVNAQNTAYTDAVLKAGGIPILIPVEVEGAWLEELFNRMDGLLFCGGADVDPACYNEHPAVENLSGLQKERDRHELAFIGMAIITFDYERSNHITKNAPSFCQSYVKYS